MAATSIGAFYLHHEHLHNFLSSVETIQGLTERRKIISEPETS
jgi:hypothetical protein